MRKKAVSTTEAKNDHKIAEKERKEEKRRQKSQVYTEVHIDLWRDLLQDEKEDASEIESKREGAGRKYFVLACSSCIAILHEREGEGETVTGMEHKDDPFCLQLIS